MPASVSADSQVAHPLAVNIEAPFITKKSAPVGLPYVEDPKAIPAPVVTMKLPYPASLHPSFPPRPVQVVWVQDSDDEASAPFHESASLDTEVQLPHSEEKPEPLELSASGTLIAPPRDLTLHARKSYLSLVKENTATSPRPGMPISAMKTVKDLSPQSTCHSLSQVQNVNESATPPDSGKILTNSGNIFCNINDAASLEASDQVVCTRITSILYRYFSNIFLDCVYQHYHCGLESPPPHVRPA